jgi:inorganic triphosphatase YgiF
MPAGVELELKLLANGAGPLSALAALPNLGPVDLGPPTEADEEDRYLDNAAGDLAGAGWACRLRTRGQRTIVSLKGPPQHAPGEAYHRRPELEAPVAGGLDPSSWPPSEARDLLLRLAGGGPLIERLTLRQHRTERAALLAGGRIGTLSLDSVEVRRRGARLGAFHAVELELAGEEAPRVPETLVIRLAEILAAQPGLTPDPHSKLERALALLPAAKP